MGIGHLIGRRIADSYIEERNWIKERLKELPPGDLATFEQRLDERKKSIKTGYVCWWFGGTHYIYVGQKLKPFIFWITIGGLIVWYILDGFLMYFIIDAANRKISMQILDEIYNESYDRKNTPKVPEAVPTFAGVGEDIEEAQEPGSSQPLQQD